MSGKRRLLVVVLALLVLGAVGIGVGGFVGLAYVPGGRESVNFSEVFSTGEIRYTVPPEVLQAETAKSFPISMGLEGLLRLELKNPQFLPETDPTMLRVQVELDALIVATAEKFPGQAVVRTRLKFDPAAQSIALADAELTEFSFTGRMAGLADALRPVIQSALATEMNGYVIYQLPKESGWLTRTGFSLLRDVSIVDGRVVVLLGR